MAIIDESRGVLVVRIVYDGPALSGKTTSLRALASGVSSTVECPEEQAGRTLFFDWVDYIGGLFEGRQIRCQIVSVPGQRELAHRRKFLLESADAVVLVLDTRRAEWEFGLGWVKEIVPHCRAQDPPVGLVVQANKRDAPDAVPPDELRDALNGIASLATVHSTATTGDGIREAFVLAVRLALDRVRALAATGRLLAGTPPDDDAQGLLDRMRSADSNGERKLEYSFARAVAGSLQAELDPVYLRPAVDQGDMAERAADSHEEAAFVPDPMMPGGMIWPPVDGRTLLHEVATLGIQASRTRQADWCGSGSGFRFHSFGDAIFADLPRARNELIEWARLHAANAHHLSPGRAVILADAGLGRLRLWQIVRAEAALRERLALAMPLDNPSEVADELLSVATQLVAARDSFAVTTFGLPCTLWTISASSSSRPTYVGLMPSRERHVSSEPAERELLERELSPHLRELRRARVDYDEVVQRVRSLADFARADSAASWLADLVHAT